MAAKNLADYLSETIIWESVPVGVMIDGHYLLVNKAKLSTEEELKLGLGDIPEEDLYHLFVGRELVGSFNEWPEDWINLDFLSFHEAIARILAR